MPHDHLEVKEMSVTFYLPGDAHDEAQGRLPHVGNRIKATVDGVEQEFRVLLLHVEGNEATIEVVRR